MDWAPTERDAVDAKSGQGFIRLPANVRLLRCDIHHAGKPKALAPN